MTSLTSLTSSLDASTLWNAIGAQIRNNARLSFELQFRTVKRRLDIELNAKKEVYNNIENTPSPLLAELKREREAVDAKRKEVVAYLDVMKSNVTKIDEIIKSFIPTLNEAASEVGPGAEETFNRLKDRLNERLRSFVPAKYYEEGFLDLTAGVKSLANPSGLKNYDEYVGVADRAGAVGHVVTLPTDDQQVATGLSAGYALELGQLRSKMLRDFDRANGILGKTEPKLSASGAPLVDEKGQPVTVPISGLVKRQADLDARIEKVDAEQRLVVLKDVQAMEKKHDRILESLSLSFEFSIANSEIFASRANFLKPDKGSILNLFI